MRTPKSDPSLDRAGLPQRDAVSSAVRWVFVSLSTCGHAQSVYGDMPDSDLAENVLGDLRVGLIVKRITLDDWKTNYAKALLCGCPTVGHERDAAFAALSDQHGPESGRSDQPIQPGRTKY